MHEGDTLAGIAAFYGVPVSVLLEANGLTDPAALTVGQTLIIPVAPVATSTPAP